MGLDLSFGAGTQNIEKKLGIVKQSGLKENIRSTLNMVI